jgi:antirestriction protein ArdC
MSTIDHTATDKRDFYARVTAQITNATEQGVGTWRMPWHTSGRYAFSPINATSKKPYRGINTVCLWAAAQAKGYEQGEWATYQQWQDKGAQVRRGEKATLVVFWKFANDSGESQDDGAESIFTAASKAQHATDWLIARAASARAWRRWRHEHRTRSHTQSLAAR